VECVVHCFVENVSTAFSADVRFEFVLEELEEYDDEDEDVGEVLGTGPEGFLGI